MDNADHPWKSCLLCAADDGFHSPEAFVRHLRQKHCRQEGGSFVCHYGYNRVCSSLPLEGVSDVDYEHHVLKHHVYPKGAIRKEGGSRTSSVSSSSSSHQSGAAADGLRWSLHSAAQNLPAVLNDPGRGRQRDFFTKTWGDGFVEREVTPSPRLATVTLADFQAYLRDTSKRYKKHLRKSNTFKKESLTRGRTKLSRIGEPEEDGMGLSSVPRLFFDPTFDLSRPEVFPVICPAADGCAATGGEPHRPAAAAQRRQTAPGEGGRRWSHELTHYLDIVEVQIARQIADKSEAFFDAMSSHDSLMEQLSQASRSVRALRERTKFTLEHEVTAALRVISGRQRQHNCARVLKKLRLMATVHQTQPTIQLLLTTSEFVGALDLIATSQEVLAQELAGVQAFKHLSSQLTEMERVIDKMVSADFVRHVTSDLNRPLDQQQPAEEVVGERIRVSRHVPGGQCRGPARSPPAVGGRYRMTPLRVTASRTNTGVFAGLMALTDRSAGLAFGRSGGLLGDAILASPLEQLVSIMFGMLRLKNYNMVGVYKDEACTTVRAVVKQTVIEAVVAGEPAAVSDVMDDVLDAAMGRPRVPLTNGGKADNGQSPAPRLSMCWGREKLLTGGLARAAVVGPVLMRRLRHKETPFVLQMAYNLQLGDRFAPCPVSAKACLESRKSVRRASAARRRAPRPLHLTPPATRSTEEVEGAMMTAEENSRVRATLSAMLGAVCDYAHERCGKLLQARVREGGVESPEFLSLATLVQDFVADCEQLCGRRSTAFHLALQGQASQFVQRFHSERKTKLNLLLESERWRQADVPAEFQVIADHVYSTGEKLVEHSPERRPADVLRLGDQSFVVVGTVLLLVKMLLEYCDCARHLSSVSADLLSRLVDLLRFFNSRCCQLVVGAGAIQLVGLKTITSRNLSLAARGVQLVLQYIPLIRRHFEELLPERGRGQLRHLDQVQADYVAHLAEIDTKLVVIISGACDAQLNKWEARPPVPSQQFRAVCRAVSKLHEATSGVLAPEHSRRLFARMNGAFVESLRRCVDRLAIKRDGGPQHGLVTSELIFYQEHLKTLNFVPERPVAELLWLPDKAAALP
ncbi:vacuolar protein sorting-associated protein 54-like [Pollicipes pollicipes]|uniref:vacuolar protein sorting-associated protein 54-like n=1 Tax=Pollicipes pollicipes TaxID=41117 RepID=UPI001885654D|nr:vacuolar protein sorting-associated protein 54-like [Pollicipes pollicipes]